MLERRVKWVRSMMLLLVGGLVMGACGGSEDGGEPFSATWVYCDNPEAAAPSCSLAGYSLEDDSALRGKLTQCATSGCHGTSGIASTTWTLDLSGSVDDALSSLATFADGGPFFLVDESDPDCSQMLSEVTSKPVGAVRMPVTGGFWSTEEIECFRAYLHQLFP